MEVNSAPENYNPKLINSFINIGGDTNSSQNNINGNMPSQNNNGAVSKWGILIILIMVLMMML